MEIGWWRAPARVAVWTALVVCGLLDGAVCQYMISGSDLPFIDERGRWLTRPPLSLGDWALVAGILAFQALLVTAIIRLRRRRPPAGLFPSP